MRIKYHPFLCSLVACAKLKLLSNPTILLILKAKRKETFTLLIIGPLFRV